MRRLERKKPENEGMVKAYYKNRYELKYVMDWSTYFRMKKDIEVLFKKDPFGDKNGKYNVISLYYDTPALKFFQEKIDGEERRVKLRLRTYVHKDRIDNKRRMKQPDVFIEIKKKINKNVLKKRVYLDEKKAREFIENPSLGKPFMKLVDKKGKETLREVEYLKSIFKLKPTIVVSYTRQAFVSKDNLNVRVTFDSNIRYRRRDFSLKMKGGDNYLLPPNLLVMEIKYTDYFPLWLVQLIQKYECGIRTFSKYCTGIENYFYERPVLGDLYGMVY